MHIDPNQTRLQIFGERKINPNPTTIHSNGKQVDRPDFGSTYQKYIELAVSQENRQNSNIVEQARKSLESGELDSAESARLAAQAILGFGV